MFCCFPLQLYHWVEADEKNLWKCTTTTKYKRTERTFCSHQRIIKSSTKITKIKLSRQWMCLEKRTGMDRLYIYKKFDYWSLQEAITGLFWESENFKKKSKLTSNDLIFCIYTFPICWKKNDYLVTKSTLFCANISDEVPSLFSHLIQEHITEGKTAVSNVMALVGRWKQHRSQESHLNKTLEISLKVQLKSYSN